MTDWTEQGLTSPPTQYRLSGRQFYRSKDPTNRIKVLKEKLASQRPNDAICGSIKWKMAAGGHLGYTKKPVTSHLSPVDALK